MKQRLIDLTPDTKYYVVNDGKVVAAKFIKAEVRLTNQFSPNSSCGLDCTLLGVLQLANGKQVPTKMIYRVIYNELWDSNHKLYATPEDACNQTNCVTLTMTRAEFVTFMGKFGYTPTLEDYHGVTANNNWYSMWCFNRDSDKFGAKLTPIRIVDLFKGTVTTDAGPEVYNTRKECEDANRVEVVEFDDEPAEDTTADNDPFAVHFVLIEVIK